MWLISKLGHLKQIRRNAICINATWTILALLEEGAAAVPFPGIFSTLPHAQSFNAGVSKMGDTTSLDSSLFQPRAPLCRHTLALQSTTTLQQAWRLKESTGQDRASAKKYYSMHIISQTQMHDNGIGRQHSQKSPKSTTTCVHRPLPSKHAQQCEGTIKICWYGSPDWYKLLPLRLGR